MYLNFLPLSLLLNRLYDHRTELNSKGVSSLFKEIKIERFTCPDPAYTTDEIYTQAYYRVRTPWFLESNKRVSNLLRENLLNINSTNANELGEIPMSDLDEVGLILMVPCSVSQGLSGVNRLVEFGHGIFAGYIFL